MRHQTKETIGENFVLLEGHGLHTGEPCSVRVHHTKEPTTIAINHSASIPLSQVRMEGRLRASALLIDGQTVFTPEHCFAAMVGLQAFEGLHIHVLGPEFPLLDGCALTYANAMATVMTPPRCAHRLAITKECTIRIDGSTYQFRPTSVQTAIVHVDFSEERMGRTISGQSAWDGSRDIFMKKIAPSRTFGAKKELAYLRSMGLATHIRKGVVVALDGEPDERPRDDDEPINHKLLDLLGDLAILAAPWLGTIEAHLPSHKHTHEAIQQALSQNVFRTVKVSA